MNKNDLIYQRLIQRVLHCGQRIETRNHAAYSLIDSDALTITSTPLITVRKAAWRKALREMEWFLSGDAKCPDELLDWWEGQLNENNEYLCGYGIQLRSHDSSIVTQGFDQIRNLLHGLSKHPYSRRHVMTTWQPWEMNHITAINGNPKTPSTCHGTILQYFVRNGKLHCAHYQRSCDLLLGLPHNFIQHWGLLLWLARQAQLDAGGIRWIFGDLHCYDEPSHLEVAAAISECNLHERTLPPPQLVYHGGIGSEFKASDFEMAGAIEEPITTTRPKLL